MIIPLFTLSESPMVIPKTMKAAILVEQRKPLVIDEVELPQSLDVGQDLLQWQLWLTDR